MFFYAMPENPLLFKGNPPRSTVLRSRKIDGTDDRTFAVQHPRERQSSTCDGDWSLKDFGHGLKAT
jgi:hypothetical protein